jgi:predicted nucleic acid-binding protein
MMPWVVDTCLLIDVAEADPAYGVASAQLLERNRWEGLTICPVTYVEFAPVFNGDQSAQNEFLFNLGVNWLESWSRLDTEEAHRAWHRYVAIRRATRAVKRPIADILIGAFAARFDGILTRNDADFVKVFPTLVIRVP